MYKLSKSTYIRGLQCVKSLYLHKKRGFLRDKLPKQQLARFKRGHEVGILAQSLYPGGIDCSPSSPSGLMKAAVKTAEYIQQGESILYEAVFIYQDVLIMLDILIKQGNSWLALEVKSSRSLSETYYKDAALQYFVLNGNGINIADFQLIHINPEYVRNGALIVEDLFVHVSCFDFVKSSVLKTECLVNELKSVPGLEHSPDIPPGIHCFEPYSCDFFVHCWKGIQKPLIHTLWTVSDDKKTAMIRQGILGYDMIPQTEKNSVAETEKRAIADGRMQMETSKIPLIISQSETSVYFVAIATSNFAIPPVNGLRPYESLVFGICIMEDNSQSPSELYLPIERYSNQAVKNFLAEILPEQAVVITDSPDVLRCILSIEDRVVDIFDIIQTEFFYMPAVKSGFGSLMVNTQWAQKPGGDPDDMETEISNGYIKKSAHHREKSMSYLRWKSEAMKNAIKKIKNFVEKS